MAMEIVCSSARVIVVQVTTRTRVLMCSLVNAAVTVSCLLLESCVGRHYAVLAKLKIIFDFKFTDLMFLRTAGRLAPLLPWRPSLKPIATSWLSKISIVMSPYFCLQLTSYTSPYISSGWTIVYACRRQQL